MNPAIPRVKCLTRLRNCAEDLLNGASVDLHRMAVIVEGPWEARLGA